MGFAATARSSGPTSHWSRLPTVLNLIDSLLMSTKTPEKVSRKSSGNKTVSTPTNDDLLAGGGGSAPAAGVSFQAAVGAFFAVSGMAPCKVDERLELGAERILSFRFETEAPIDDILILTSGPGRLFFQAKTNLRFGEQPSSEMVKTVEQIVRQWKLCSAGDGSKGWNKPLGSRQRSLCYRCRSRDP